MQEDAAKRTSGEPDLPEIVQQLRFIFETEFSHGVAPLRTDGLDASSKMFGDAIERLATRIQLKHLPFTRTQYAGLAGDIVEMGFQQCLRVCRHETPAAD